MKKRHISIVIGFFLILLSRSVFASNASLTDHEALAREIFSTVIGLDTSVAGRRTPEMAAYLVGLFKGAGFPEDDVMEIPVSPSQTSLVVRYRGRNQDAKAIGFLAHMDVVTAMAKDWVLDPFLLTEKDGYFIGRGSADNKAGVAGLTATFLKLKKAGYVPERNMVLVFTSDEETGMLSARHIATQLSDQLDIEYAINSDGMSGVLLPDGNLYGYYVQGAEKSYSTVELTVRNPGGHSSAPRADNAIYQLAKALTKIEAYQFPVSLNEISAGMLSFAASRSDETEAAAINRLLADPADTNAAAIVSRNPLNARLIRTTCIATMLKAGHAENALAQSATATVNCRIMPGIAPEQVYATLAEVVDDSMVELHFAGDNINAPASPMRVDVMASIKYALADLYPNVELVPFMASYGTDGREFRAVGIPVYGSSGAFMDPNEAFAHGLNEKISVKAFYDSLIYWERLMTHLTRAMDVKKTASKKSIDHHFLKLTPVLGTYGGR